MLSRKRSDKSKSVTLDSRSSKPAHNNPSPTSQPKAAERPSLGRHAVNCRICAHPRRQEIEEDFVAWRSPKQIAKDYGLADRSSVYRHAHALNLFPRRRRNVRAPLESLIERADDVKVNASAVIAAIQALSKINARGEWIEPDERLWLHDLFDRMKPEEYEAYAEDRILPKWFREDIAAAGGQVPKGDEHE